MSSAHRLPGVVDEQVVGRGRPAHRQPGQRRVRLHRIGVVGRFGGGRDRARERRLVAKAAGAVDGAQQRHQDRQRANGLEAVAVRSQAAHRMEGHRVAGDGVVLLAPAVGPGDRQLDLLVARGHAHLVRQAPDGLGRDAGDALGPFGRVLAHALGQQLERRLDLAPVVEREAAAQLRVDAFAVRGHGLAGLAVPPQLVLRIGRVDLGAGRVLDMQAEVVAGLVGVDQLAGIGVAHQEVAVVQPGQDQLVDQRQQQRAVGAGADRHPLVGDRRVAGAHRVDRDEAAAVALELGDRDLQRVGVVVLGGADHHEQLGAIEVGAAELPERAADRVDHARGHVDRAEAAMRGVVGRAELAREHAGQRLHLVAPGEQRELLRVGGADLGQALGQGRERLFPRDRLELGAAALGAGLAPQRLGQARGRILLHDARRALGADHALVQRVVGVAVDVAQLPVLQVHADAAAAGAHVAGGVLDLARRRRRGRGGVMQRSGGRRSQGSSMAIARRPS